MTKEKISIGIIGGTGVYDPGMLKNAKQVKVNTPYGSPSDLITVGDYAGAKVAFLPRHGSTHCFPPHNVPYRANIWALKELGVERILAPCAVGGLKDGLPPGHIVIPDSFFDFTKGRQYTYYDGPQVCHISVAEPFCEELRKLAISAAKKLKANCQEGGTTVTIQGPRYSSRAESFFFRDTVKADIVGMTLVPECLLARELEICYVSIAAVTDYDSWCEETVDTSTVKKVMKKNLETIRGMLIEMIPKIPKQRSKCACYNALENAMM